VLSHTHEINLLAHKHYILLQQTLKHLVFTHGTCGNHVPHHIRTFNGVKTLKEDAQLWPTVIMLYYYINTEIQS
jgi:hypothetical protein